MRAHLQRVKSARVEVAGEVTGAISHGLLVLLGVGKGDTDDDRRWLLEKILGLRIFENEAGKMDKSVVEEGGSLLVVSQFTLFADVRKGRRPNFDGAAPPEEANMHYTLFVEEARRSLAVETGRFRATMDVHLVNDGPVTLLLDSRTR